MAVPWLERLSNTKNEELDPGLDPNQTFNDCGSDGLIEKLLLSNNTKDGMDTRPIDFFRQGVELTQQKFRFGSTQPKLWTGNIKHWIDPNIIGQAVDFSKFDQTTQYTDSSEGRKWDPVEHLLNDIPNSLILFNEGLQQQSRSSIDPLFIQGKKNTIEDIKDPITGIKCDGGIPIKQLVRRNSPALISLENTRGRFADNGMGDEFMANTYIPIDYYWQYLYTNAWVDDTRSIIDPYHDEVQVNNELNPLILQLTNPSSDIISALISNSNLDLDESDEVDFEYRSATAGYQFGDCTTALYGSDSIAFGGMLRGW